MTGTDASLTPRPLTGVANATGTADMTLVAQGVWVPVPGAVANLPAAGLYLIYADVRGGLVSFNPPVDESLFARLFNETAGTPVPETDTEIVRLVYPVDTPLIPNGNGTEKRVGAGGTASLHWTGQVTGPTVIRLEARREIGGQNATDPGATLSGVGSDVEGYTRMGWIKIS